MLEPVTALVSAVGTLLGAGAAWGALHFARTWRRQYLQKESHSDLLDLKKYARDWLRSLAVVTQQFSELPKPQSIAENEYVFAHIPNYLHDKVKNVRQLTLELEDKFAMFRTAHIRLRQSGYHKHDDLYRKIGLFHVEFVDTKDSYERCMYPTSSTNWPSEEKVIKHLQQNGFGDLDRERVQNFFANESFIARLSLDCAQAVREIEDLKSPI